jgi:methionyl-tRNA formyltransferase
MLTAILTYDAPHRKTQDVLLRMKALGHADLLVVATPWAERKNFKPIFQHRPSEALPLSLDQFCENLGYPLLKLPYEEVIPELNARGIDYVIIAGAGIVPGKIAERFRIINAHPGYLPYVKGLDALKWAILEGQPIGVTCHFISAEVDEGELIKQELVPLYYEDTFHSLAYRVYELEIKLLSESLTDLSERAEIVNLADRENRYPAHRRMPHHLERKMMESFEALRRAAPSVVEGGE